MVSTLILVVASFYMEESEGMALSQANHKPVYWYSTWMIFSTGYMALTS
jgi:hypothetical protein